MKIAYVHGFASSSQAGTVERLKRAFPDAQVIAYDMPVRPLEAVKFLRRRVYEDDIDIVFGTSLGAYYTLHTSGCAKVVLNPPFNPNDVLDDYVGTYVEYLKPRKDGSTKFAWTQACHDQIEYLNQDFEDPDWEIQDESFLFFGTEDDVVTDNKRFDDTWNKTYISGGHRMTDEMFEEILPKLQEISQYFK